MRSRVALAAFIAALPTFVLPAPANPGPPALPPEAAALSVAAPLAEGPATQPNFVVIVTDDQKWDTIGRCLPVLDPYDFDAGTDACMPNLQEKLMDLGTTFLKGEVTQSLCCPSRASILTGQYSTTNGVTYNNGSLLDDTSTIATWLHDAGYRTGLIGKYLNGYGVGPLEEHIPPGWDSFHSYHGFNNSDDPYTDYPWISWDVGDIDPLVTRYNDADSTSGEACADGNLYSTDFMCSLSLDFIAADQTQPFFLYVAPASPHTPTTVATRHTGLFATVDIPPYPDTNVLPSPNPPSYLPTGEIRERTLDRIERTMRSALELTLSVDDMIAALHDQLTAEGRLDNTVWVFISDNGIASGEHRWRNKGCEYYVCHRVPFVVVCPLGVCGTAQPGVSDPSNYALNIDIAPTLADLAGTTPTVAVDGLSLVPILNDPAAAWRNEWFMHGNDPEYEGIVGVGVDGDIYKYVELTDTAEFEMYNLDDDPWELANLAGDAAYTSVETDLAARLATHLAGGPPPNVAPTASFTSSCTDLDCDFTNTSTDSDGTVDLWDWNFGDGNTSTLQNPTNTYATVGTYTVTLTVTDNDGDTGVVSNDVTVSGPNVAPTAGFTSSCTDLDCDFTNTSTDSDGTVDLWDWNFGDGNTSTLQNPSHNYSAGGTFTVSLTVTDNDGATHTTTNDITVEEPGSGTGAFIEIGGQVVFEAEHYSLSVERSDHAWVVTTAEAGFSGDSAMRSDPDDGTRIRTDFDLLSPEMSFDVDFLTTGTYYVWLRAWAPDVRGKAMFAGIDGVPANAGIAAGGSGAWGAGVGEWTWSNSGRTGAAVVVEVAAPGVHTLHVWMGDDGVIVDKAVMTTDSGFMPADEGPPESPRTSALNRFL